MSNTGMALNIDGVPAELRALPRWVVWRRDSVGPGKTTKVPYQPIRPEARASATDPATWASFDDAVSVARGCGFAGVGVCLGDLDDGRVLAGVDLDDCLVDGVLADEAAAIVESLPSYWEISPSGQGLKAICYGRKPDGAKCIAKPEGFARVEVYDGGRWFAVTGQRFAGDAVRPAQSQLAALVDRVGLANPDPAPAPMPIARPSYDGDTAAARASAYLATMPPAIQGAGGHSALYAAATAMAHGFDLGRGQTIDILAREFNPRCVPAWDMSNPSERREFERKVDQAIGKPHDQPRGWLRDSMSFTPAPVGGVDVGALVSSAAARQAPASQAPAVAAASPEQATTVDGGPIPIAGHLLQPPGLLGRVAGWINATAAQHQPELSLGNAIAFVGAVVGRKVRSESDARTNFYCLGLGESCCGKNHSREQVGRLAQLAGVERLLAGEDVSSDAALMRIAAETPALLLQLDEIGHFLSAKGSAMASTHERAIVPTLTKLFTSSNGTMRGKEYADGDKRERVDIDQPNVCLYGTATAGQLFGSISLEQITDGFMGRLLIFASSDFDPDWRKVADKNPPKDLIDLVRAWGEWTPPAAEGAGNIEAITPGPLTVPATDEAERVLDGFRDYARAERRRLKLAGGLHPLWGRAYEQSIKLALLASMDEPRPDVRINVEAARWASELVATLIDGIIAVAAKNVADSDHERTVQRVMATIAKGGPAGVRRMDVSRSCRRTPARIRDEIVKDLARDGVIRIEHRTDGRGPVGEWYVAN